MTAPTADPQGASVRVVTFNLRRDLGGFSVQRADRWSERRGRVESFLRAEHPDVLATQEVLPEQARFVRSALGDSYRCLGRGRARNGAGEGCPVFYNTERLELLTWRQTMLSNTPERAGSRLRGAVFPRVVVSASFRDRSNGSRVRILNTHLDPLCRRTRLRSAALIRAQVRSSTEPTVLTGDLNDGPDSATVAALLEDGVLRDAWQAARRRVTPEYATFARYRSPRLGRRIDWIMTTPDIGVESIAIHADQIDGGWPSDHLPVQAALLLPKGETAHD